MGGAKKRKRLRLLANINVLWNDVEKNKKEFLDKQMKEHEERQKVLKGIRANAFKNADGFIKALMAKGYKEIGSGYYSSVLAHPNSDKVIKVSKRAHSDGWIDYVKWADSKGYAGTFAPLVHSYKFIKTRERGYWSWDDENKDQNGFGIAVMERLDKTLHKVHETRNAKFFGEAVKFTLNYNNELSAKFVDQYVPGFNKFLIELRQEFKSLDIHDGNFMVRKDGSLVVTDPVSASGKKKGQGYLGRWRSACPNVLNVPVVVGTTPSLTPTPTNGCGSALSTAGVPY